MNEERGEQAETQFLPMTLIRCGGLPLSAWLPLACGLPDWAARQKAEQAAAEQMLRAFDDALFSLPHSPLRTAVYNARKDFFQHRKLPSAHFEAKIQEAQNLAQLLDCLHSFKKTKEQTQAAETIFEQNLAANYRALQTAARDETMRRALLFASHDLLASLPAFAEKPVEQFDKKDRRTALSLLQYLTRAVFKTSPLGRFTTVQVRGFAVIDGVREGGVQPAKNVKPRDGGLSGLNPALPHPANMPKPLVTPNVALLPAIYEVLLHQPAFFQSLSLSLNPCISQLPESFKLSGSSFPSWLYFDGEREAFQQIDPDPVADFVVKTLLENGRQMPFQQLTVLLENEVEATAEQLQTLVFKLLDIGLLEWQLPERGLSPGWCGGLYNYLGYLPSSPVLTEAAYLLQWLRTAARTLPFQTVEDAQAMQRDALRETKTFLEKHGCEMPSIPPEQVFFEDVAQDVALDLPPGTIEKLTGQLAECWREKDFHTLPPFRARLLAFAEKAVPDGQSVDFLEFSKRFLAGEVREGGVQPAQDDSSGLNPALPHPRHRGNVGALLQIFQENGEYKAVVNAMYPGGGKLFARWLSLFPSEVLEKLKTWFELPPSGGLACPPKGRRWEEASFPWQGWSNANFQPALSGVSLAVPDGRVGHSPSGRTVLLGNLAVRMDERGVPQLIEKQSNQPLALNDLGLEAPETRPPVMQVLWSLGVPFVSLESLLPDGMGWGRAGGIRHRSREEFQSLVLSREAWELPPEAWGKLFPRGKSKGAQIGLGVAALKDWGIPRQFFGQYTAGREKPQFFDMESPISMLLLEKKLRGGSGNLLLTEMLPTPEQWLGDRVGEFVVEFQVSKFQVPSSK